MNTNPYKTKTCTLDGLLREVAPAFPEQVEALRRKFSMSMEIVQRRVAAGLTQTELARRIGCSQSRISKLERSENDKIGMEDYLKCVCATSTQKGIASSSVGIAEQITRVDWGKLSNYMERLLIAAPIPPPQKKRQRRASFTK